LDFTGRKILLTGGTSGLGLEIAKILISGGAEVYAMGRDLKGYSFANEKFRFIKADFADLKDLKASLSDILSQQIRFDVIINNAGVLSPPGYLETKDGFEYSFQVNFLSHLLINEMIIENKAYSDPLTILAVTSPVYKHIKPDFTFPGKNDYRPFRVYSESKFYLLLMGNYLKDEFKSDKFSFVGFNPGTFGSGIYRMQKPWFHIMYKIAAPFMRSPSKVAGSICRLLEKGEYAFTGIYSVNGTKPSVLRSYPVEASEFLRRCSEKTTG
jgi:NAD(P)-dependent dehydrogenase (short-subunit alcohol dehydrogenase family)